MDFSFNLRAPFNLVAVELINIEIFLKYQYIGLYSWEKKENHHLSWEHCLNLLRNSQKKHLNTVEFRFFEPPRGTKIGSKNRRVREIGGKISVRLRRGNDFWFELSGGSKKRGFEKSGFHCKCIHFCDVPKSCIYERKRFRLSLKVAVNF